MAICNYFLQGRCRYGDRCWNEHPRGGGGGGRQEQSRYHYQQPPAGSRTWTSSNQRYVQPSNFSRSTTWTRDNSQTSYAPHSDSHDNRSRNYNSGTSAGSFSTQNQNRFSTLPSQDHSKAQSDKDGSLFEDIKRDLDAWESSGQWIFSVYCVSKDTSNAAGFADISPEELRLECYTARDSGNMQSYVNSVQQLATQWKQRVHAIKNTNISSQTALINELTKPAVSSAPMIGGQQNSSFPNASSSTSSAPQSASSFSFKQDSQAPSAGPISSFPTASGFANKPATGFSNTVTGSAASFTFAATTVSDGASAGFHNPKAVSASTFSFAPTTSGAGASAFSGFGAATTALPAVTSSPASGDFGGTTAASGFGQSTTSGFGGITAASGFGQSTTSGFGGTTAASGFGQSTASGFGGTTAASGFGQSTTSGFGGTTAASGFGQSTTSGFGGTTAASGFGQSTTSGFGGTTAASGFGQSTTSGFGGTTAASGFGQSATSVFGGGPSISGFEGLAANTVTSGFGAKTSAVSDLFKTGAASSATTSVFGQALGVSVSRPPSVASTSEASSKNSVFTPRSELSDKELSQFESKKFSLGNIPIHPPPADLLKAC